VPVVSVLDGHSHALAFIGSALGVPHFPLGVDSFGQSGTRGDLYRHYAIDAEAIARAAGILLGRRECEGDPGPEPGSGELSSEF
jgi:pyruvate dehydrogenase E1 component